ncbi:hypothetical protein GCM10010327_42710 [Streptomyces nitrosporeus]|nr:hypothetical protein GCM10010327_42710 [Streptomyces nitrosporeus]
MTAPARPAPLLDRSCERLVKRITGPSADSGNGTDVPVPALTDEEFFREPVPGCWSVRRRFGGPGPGASSLSGAGEWGRDTAAFPIRPHLRSPPWPGV